MRSSKRPSPRDQSDVILLDTSAAVALCSQDHPAHQAVIDAAGEAPIGLAGHAWFETFSVLTRLPPPQRRAPGDVLHLMRHNFPATVFLTEETQRAFCAALGVSVDSSVVSGGAIYDALVGLAARQAKLPLLSRDPRAAATYAALAVEFTLLN
jgi:toxin FitB